VGKRGFKKAVRASYQKHKDFVSVSGKFAFSDRGGKYQKDEKIVVHLRKKGVAAWAEG